MTSGSKTKFEKDLEVYFPELFDLYGLMKKDKRVWVVIKAMLGMAQLRQYGSVVITYQDGKINVIEKTTKVND